MFLALPVPAGSFSPVMEWLERFSRCLKIVPVENHHITLKFLGNTERTSYEKLLEALDSGIIPEKVECTFKGLGCFPGTGDPKVIWSGMEYAAGAMERVFDFTEKSAVAAGFPAEQRKFIPHMTLARIRKDAHVPPGLKELIKKNKDTFFFTHVFDNIVLYESILRKNGPEYREIKKWKLI